jgi:lipopolysaccharide/colanic/teichoic acid biosynthesis glycosyltransferase
MLVALLVLLDSPGPVVYRARRIGMGGRPFEMLKFRTMHVGSEGAAVSAHGDSRVTPVGRLLRVSRLDELPQLWNVLRGEMSIVGPRPEDEEFVAAYRSDYERILSVPPGLTGPSQVRFAAGEARALASSSDPVAHYMRIVLPGKVALDLEYARTHTLIGDLAIIGQTMVLPLRQLTARFAALLRGRPASVYAQERRERKPTPTPAAASSTSSPIAAVSEVTPSVGPEDPLDSDLAASRIATSSSVSALSRSAGGAPGTRPEVPKLFSDR